MKLSIIVPCYNEKATISAILDQIWAVKLDIEKEVVVVDDASRDGTQALLKGELRSKITTLILSEHNGGKGASIAKGMDAATGDILIIQDADLEYTPEDYPAVIQPIIDGKTDVVYGSRFTQKERHPGSKWTHYWGNQLLTMLSNWVTGYSLTDMETCYKAFSRKVYPKLNIQEKRFGMEPEITAKLSRMNVEIIEVPIQYKARGVEEGKKITWKDGVSALRCIVKYRYFKSGISLDYLQIEN